MIGPTARVRRALGCIAGAAIADVAVELLLVLILRVNIDVLFYYESPLVIALPLLVGLGAAIGLEVAAAEPQTAGRISVWDRSIDLASLILLGILCGGLVTAFIYERSPSSMVEAAIALAFLAFGVAATRTLARWRVSDATAIRVAPFYAILGLLYGLGTIAGATLAFAITWRPCPPFVSCIEPPTWQSYMLTTSIFVGLPLGIWLAIALWLALTLGRRATPQMPVSLAS